jgi:hypothetical protein
MLVEPEAWTVDAKSGGAEEELVEQSDGELAVSEVLGPSFYIEV